jgi:hypothetical protein
MYFIKKNIFCKRYNSHRSNSCRTQHLRKKHDLADLFRSEKVIHVNISLQKSEHPRSVTCMVLDLFCVLKKWGHYRFGQCGRPAVYTTTLHNYIRLSWNFVHRIISSISRSSSKMGRIRQEMTELSKKLSSIHEGGEGFRDFFFKKIFFSELFNIYMNRLSF